MNVDYKYKILFLNITFKMLIAILLTTSLTAHSQKKPVRVEINANTDDSDFEVITLQKSGLLLLNKFYKNIDKLTISYQISYFDINLKKKWSKDINVSKNSSYQSFSKENDSIVYLFFADNSQKNSETNCNFIKLNIFNYNYSSKILKFNDKVIFLNFIQCNDNIYIALENYNDKAAIVKYDYINEGYKEFFFNKKDHIHAIDYNSNEILCVIERPTIEDTENSFFIYKFDKNIEVINQANLSKIEKDKIPNTFYIKTNENNIWLFGTYLNQKDNSPDKKNNKNTGFFASLIKDTQTVIMKYYNFIHYKNFYSYFTFDDIIKIKKKAERKNLSDDDISLNYPLLVHKPIFYKNQNVLIAEVYNPEYRTVSRTGTDFYGRPIPESYTVFDGYRFSNALIMSLNDSCNFLWNNNFEIFDILSLDLYPRINPIFNDTNLVLTYANNNKVLYKVIHENNIIDGPDHFKIESGYTSDKLEEEKRNNIQTFYDNYYLVYGYQLIKNNISPNRNDRTYFYINKIAYGY